MSETAKLRREPPPTAASVEQKRLQAAHERLVSRLKRVFFGILMLGYFALGVYLLSPKSGATEEQKRFAENVLVALAGGATGYLFGRNEGKSEKG